jgi:glutamyl-tRNA reductase
VTAQLFYLGLTHHSAPLAIRENLRPDREKQRTMLARLANLAEGRMVLSTCERFEVYATTPCTDAADWVGLLSHWFHLPVGLLERHLRTNVGSAVARHLLRVGAGLESRIVGETQILGQVRDAFLQATQSRCLDADLSALGRAAIRTGKRVRTETSINSGARSIATIAVEHIACASGPLRDRAALILGSGKLAAVVAAELALRRAGRIVVAGRNVDRAAALAQQFGGVSLGMDQLAVAVSEADAVIACTSSPSYVADASMIGRHRVKPLCLVDLSVPRNIDPAVTPLSGVSLMHLDELLAGQSAREEGIAAAERIVEEELGRHNAWREERQVAPQIAQLIREARAGGADKRALHERIVRLKAGVAA